jgi:hypothetical protein
VQQSEAEEQAGEMRSGSQEEVRSEEENDQDQEVGAHRHS